MRYLQISSFDSVLILTLLSTLGVSQANSVLDKSTGYTLCTSPVCEDTGDEIIKNLDESVNPCDDFYNHACGGYAANHSTSEKQQARSPQEVLKIKVESHLFVILQRNGSTKSQTLRKVREFYNSCRNLAKIDREGLNPLKLILSANGGWPLIISSRQWTRQMRNLSLQKIHENYSKVAGRSALFNIKVHSEPLNFNSVIPHHMLLLQRPVVFPMDPLVRKHSYVTRMNEQRFDSHFFAYARYAKAVSTELFIWQSHFPRNNLNEELARMFDFEISLAGIYTNVMRNNSDAPTVERITTIAEVQNIWDAEISGHPDYAIDWLETIRSAFEGTGIVIDSSEKIALVPGNILEKLAKLLKQTPFRTVVNYVHWHAIDGLIPYTNKRMRGISNGLYQNRYRFEVNDNQRLISCIKDHKMLEGLSYVYLRTLYGDHNSSTVMDMVTEIQSEMKRAIERSTWMNDEAKFEFKDKIDNMVKNIEYPSSNNESGKMEEFYRDLEVGPNYLENVVNYNKFKMIKQLRKLREPYSILEAVRPFRPMQVNAGYGHHLNSMNFPAAIFQLPIYHDHRPLVMNYGSLGSIIGNVISHAFDKKGIMYDKEGNNQQWLTNSTIDKYNEKTKCFLQQYSNNTFFDTHLTEAMKFDGDRFLAQNIGDDTGFIIALNAYLSYRKQHKVEDIKIPTLINYTDEQLFFYSLTNQHFCALQDTDAATPKNSRHISASVRINKIVSNMREFSQAFNCPSGSPMNPVEKCLLWE